MPKLKLLTRDAVCEVARTSRPYSIGGWTLTVEDLIITHTTRNDWFGTYVSLKVAAAERVCRTLNDEAPWGTAVPPKDVQKELVMTGSSSKVIEGKTVPTPRQVASRSKAIRAA